MHRWLLFLSHAIGAVAFLPAALPCCYRDNFREECCFTFGVEGRQDQGGGITVVIHEEEEEEPPRALD